MLASIDILSTLSYNTCMTICKCMEAYIAGFVDADGSIPLRENGYPSLIVANTNREVLEEMQSWSGVGQVHRRQKKRERRKEIFHWEVHGEDAQQILKRVLPFLRIKRNRAKFGLTWIPKPRGRPIGQIHIIDTTHFIPASKL